MLVTKEQILEWIDNPVTLVVRKLSLWECNNTKWMPISDCWCPGEPQKTQEQLLENRIKLDEWTAFINVLDGKLKDTFVLDDESEDRFNKLVEEFKDERDEGSDEEGS